MEVPGRRGAFQYVVFVSPAVARGDARGVYPWSNPHDTLETNVSGNLVMESATHVEQKKTR